MAVSVVQHRSTQTTNATSVSLAFASNNTASNLLVYGTGGNGAVANNAATDNNTNTIANATTASGGSNANSSCRVDYVASAHSGANTVTAHTAASVDPHLHIWEISGCTTVTPLRATGATGSMTTLSVSTSTSTPQTGDAVIGMFMDDVTGATLTAGTGYSPSELSTSAGGDSALTEFKAATGNGTQTATAGGNGTDDCAGIVAVFIAAAGGSAFDIPQLGMMGVGF